MAQARGKQGLNSEMFLTSGKKCLVLNYVICLIHEDRFAIPVKLTLIQAEKNFPEGSKPLRECIYFEMYN